MLCSFFIFSKSLKCIFNYYIIINSYFYYIQIFRYIYYFVHCEKILLLEEIHYLDTDIIFKYFDFIFYYLIFIHIIFYIIKMSLYPKSRIVHLQFELWCSKTSPPGGAVQGPMKISLREQTGLLRVRSALLHMIKS